MTFTNKNKWSTSSPNVIGSPSQLPTTKLVSTGGLVGIRQATYQMGLSWGGWGSPMEGVGQSLKLSNWKKSKLAHPITGRQVRGRRPSLVPLTSYVPRLNMSETSIRLQLSCGATLIPEAMGHILMELSTTS